MTGYQKNFRLNRVLLISSCVFAIAAPNAHAQVENATRTADPARAGQTLLGNQTLPKLMPEISVSSANVQNAPEGAENMMLTLENIQVNGVTAYNAEQIDPVYRDKLGEKISLAEVYAIANDLTRKYRNDGYILTQVYVPPQTIENGTVKLNVVEGFVDQIIIQGELSDAEEKKIREYAQGLKRTGLLDAKQMERYLLLINDLPGVTARAVLGKSPSTTGASDLTLIIERDKYDAEISVDNHGSRYLGPYQTTYSSNLNSALGLNERISMQLAGGGDKDNIDELLYGAIGFELPLSKYGTILSLLAQKTNTRPGADLEQFDVKGNSTYASATISHPVIRSRTTNWYTSLSFDLRDTDSKNNLQPTTTRDQIRSLRLGSTFQFMDRFLGLGFNAFDVEFSQGLSFLGATKSHATNKTRALGDPSYKKITFYGQRLQRVSSSVNMLIAGSGQWASAPLLSAEEFGVGGMDIGRGYDPSEIVGDNGLSGKVEIQWNEPKKVKYINDYQLFAHFDIGRVWNKDATTSAGKRDSIASAGIGVRADITEDIEAGVGLSLPLTRQRDVTNDNDPRYYFNISHKF